MNPNKRFSIGGAEKATGVKVVTIRYYEHIGLMPKPIRTKGNYRTYNQEHLARLVFIRRCRDLGFTLGQIHDFVALSAQDEGACAEVDRITTTRLKEIEWRISDLTRLADELRRIKSRCPGKGRIADCRILEALAFPKLRDHPRAPPRSTG